MIGSTRFMTMIGRLMSRSFCLSLSDSWSPEVKAKSSRAASRHSACCLVVGQEPALQFLGQRLLVGRGLIDVSCRTVRVRWGHCNYIQSS